jgi:hypothetical protein
VLVLARQSHGDPSAAGTASESRHAEARIAPEKKQQTTRGKEALVESQRNQKRFLQLLWPWASVSAYGGQPQTRSCLLMRKAAAEK